MMIPMTLGTTSMITPDTPDLAGSPTLCRKTVSTLLFNKISTFSMG